MSLLSPPVEDSKMSYKRSNTVPCRYCLTGWVRFFKWFHDRNGVLHVAVKVYAVCDNEDCPSRKGQQYELDLAA